MITRDTTWVGISQVARELGCTPRTAEKALRRVAFVFPPVGQPRRWDARVVDLIHAMRREPHRQLDVSRTDWLTQYLTGAP